MTHAFRSLLLLACLAALPGCMSLDYDLSSVPASISAKPAESGASAEPLRIEAKHVSWAHGLLGRSTPDVAGLVADAAGGHGEVAGFRVTHSAGFHDWLITHLTLTLVRMKTVVIEGELVR